MHNKNTTDPTICPAHLTATLSAATRRWNSQTNSCRAWQAAEVLAVAAAMAESRNWDSEEADREAELGLWLLRLARYEDKAGRAKAAAPAAAPTAAELAEFRAWKAGR